MPPFDGEDAPTPPLSERLRRDTAAAHAALEAELDLLNGLTPARLAWVLQRFAGFHAGWEPAVGLLLREPALFEPRRRLDALDADLGRLGVNREAGAWAPPPWLNDRVAAWGSLYVMEGSTLGGRVIGRTLREAGLGPSVYFDGRGNLTGPLWRTLKRRLNELTDPPESITAAAVATFSALTEWMRTPPPGGPLRRRADDEAA